MYHHRALELQLQQRDLGDRLKTEESVSPCCKYSHNSAEKRGMGVHVPLVHVKAASSGTGSHLVSARGDTGLDERSQDT